MERCIEPISVSLVWEKLLIGKVLICHQSSILASEGKNWDEATASYPKLSELGIKCYDHHQLGWDLSTLTEFDVRSCNWSPSFRLIVRLDNQTGSPMDNQTGQLDRFNDEQSDRFHDGQSDMFKDGQSDYLCFCSIKQRGALLPLMLVHRRKITRGLQKLNQTCNLGSISKTVY
jgi:hypothetical protein